MLDLEPIKKRREKATKGPYRAGKTLITFGADIYGPDKEYELKTPFAHYFKNVIVEGGKGTGVLRQEDADFLASSWQDIGDLIKEVETLRAKVDLLEDRLDQCTSAYYFKST